MEKYIIWKAVFTMQSTESCVKTIIIKLCFWRRVLNYYA